MNKYIKLIAANLCIAILAVILYSPGLICLRISDYSIFRAGMSIIAALALIGAFFYKPQAAERTEPKACDSERRPGP